MECSEYVTTQISDPDDIGRYPSVAIGADGLPIISHSNATDGDLMVTKCRNMECSEYVATQISDSDIVGDYSSIVIGRDGLPLISYFNGTDGDLMVTKCRNMECSEYVTTQISDPDYVGVSTSTAVGVDGLPVISHYNQTDGDLMVTKCRNMECSEYVTTQISNPDDIGHYTLIAIGVDGLPVISHSNWTDWDLMVTKCADPSCALTQGSTLTGGYMLGGWMSNSRSYSAPFNTINTIRVANPTTFSSLQLMSGGVNRIDISPSGNIGIEGTLVIGDQERSSSSWRVSRDDSSTYEIVQSLAEYNGYLYAGMGSSAGDGDIYVFDGSSWTASYQTTSYDKVMSLTVYNGKLYAGFATNLAPGGGDIYVCDPGADGKCDPTDWSESYNDGSSTYNSCNTLAVYNGYLYAGFGNGANLGDIKYCNPGSDGVCNSTSEWNDSYNLGTGVYENVWSLSVYEGKLYAGMGDSSGDSDVLMCDPAGIGSSSEICDTGSEWSISYNGAVLYVYALSVYDGKLYAGTGGSNAGDGDIYVCNPGADGDCDTTDWSLLRDGGSYEVVRSFASYNGKLYVGVGPSTGDGDILVFNGSVWKISYDGSQEGIYSLTVYGGKLYAGQGYNAAGDGDIYVMTEGMSSSYAIKFEAGSDAEKKEGAFWFEGSSEYGTSGGAGADVGVFKMSHALITTAGAFDIAEDYKAEDLSIVAGDVVVPSSISSDAIRKSDKVYEGDVLGVVSTKPGMSLTDGSLSEEDKLKMRPVALAGRVPVKVTTENGSIEKGDYLVASSKAGYAMKACGERYCKAGKVIGIALEPFGKNQVGDSIEVRKEIKEAKEEVEKKVEETRMVVEQNGASQEIVKEAEEVKEFTEVLTKGVSTSYGEGRIMMFVNSFWYVPERDGSKDEAVSQILTEDIKWKLGIEGGEGVMDIVNSSSIEMLEVLKKLTVGEVEIKGLLTAEVEAVFKGGVKIMGHVGVGEDTAGIVVMPAGETEVEVKFKEPYKGTPIINVTPQDYLGGYTVSKSSSEGFVIKIPQVYEEDIKFFWLVVENIDS